MNYILGADCDDILVQNIYIAHGGEQYGKI
jgi:hypothetical protein